MKYLDERIQFQVSVGSTLPPIGTYKYTLKRKSDTYTGNDVTVFVGNFYYEHTYTVKLDVTDLIRNYYRNYKQIADDLHSYNEHYQDQWNGNSIYEYYVVLEFNVNGTVTTRESTHTMVATIYRYPNRNLKYNVTGNIQFIEYNSFSTSRELLLQGVKYLNDREAEWDKYALVPRYPLKSTNNYSFAATFGYGSDVSSIATKQANVNNVWTDSASFVFNLSNNIRFSSTITISLADFLETYLYEVEHRGYLLTDLNLYYQGLTSTSYYLMSKFETCMSRYYLQWMDRFGSYQSQPLKDVATYSEDFQNETIMNYQDVKSVSHISLTPKWKLQTGWIKDNIFPFYESIFVSPFLILYDTKTDMNYRVMVNGNYVEKNYQNQKSLVNLQLELEAAEEQNITY